MNHRLDGQTAERQRRTPNCGTKNVLNARDYLVFKRLIASVRLRGAFTAKYEHLLMISDIRSD